MRRVSRREILKAGAAGLGAAALGSLLPLPRDEARAASVEPKRLFIRDVMQELADGRLVFMWAFADETGPRIPGPILVARQGQALDLLIRNDSAQPHVLVVPGVAKTSLLTPGKEERLRFTAPKAGVYWYLDSLNEPVNRVLGLHGALVVLAPEAAGRRPTPYADPTPNVQRLFDALGRDEDFPGRPWSPERTRLWVFNQIDPRFNALAEQGRPVDPARLRAQFEPRFFTLNGRSGLFATTDPDTHIDAGQGEPWLIRSLNAGLATHSPHIHANHVFELSEDGVVRDNAYGVDTWMLPPLSRKDHLHPFVKPPDIPKAAWPPREESFPLHFTMHCHIEMSQTLDGGGYPWGCIADWSMLRPLA